MSAWQIEYPPRLAFASKRTTTDEVMLNFPPRPSEIGNASLHLTESVDTKATQ